MPRVWIVFALVALTACSAREDQGPRDTNLKVMRNPQGTPQEFSILPVKPLEAPADLAFLPEPTPGGPNRTDQTPKRDVVAALGGSPSRVDPQPGIGAGDQALVARASRFGVQPTIREELAAEDQAFRERRSLFSWQLFRSDRYDRAYRDQTLNPYASLEAARRAGALTPSAPPAQ